MVLLHMMLNIRNADLMLGKVLDVSSCPVHGTSPVNYQPSEITGVHTDNVVLRLPGKQKYYKDMTAERLRPNSRKPKGGGLEKPINIAIGCIHASPDSGRVSTKISGMITRSRRARELSILNVIRLLQ